MICKKCGAEAPENAVYCGICGSRVDGKKPCGNCGELNEETYAYCIHCGTRIDGKTVCGNCGEVHEGNFCPVCGYGEQPKTSATAPAKVRNNNGKQKKTGVWQTVSKILGITGSGFAMLGVLFSLIFVFFIGVDLKTSLLGRDSASVGEISEQISTLLGNKLNIFYYFGTAFEDIEALGLNTAGSVWDWQMDMAYRLTAILGLVIGILALVSVVTFATVATIVYVRNWLGYTEKKADKWTVACMASLLASVGAFYALNFAAAEVAVSYSGVSVSAGGLLKLDGATTAAVVLVTICLTMMCVCKLVAAGKESLKGKNILKSVLALVGAGFAITVLCVSQNTGLALASTSDTSSTSSYKMSISVGFSQLATFLLMIGQYDSTGGQTVALQKLIEGFDKMLVINTLAQGMVLLIVVFAVLSLVSNVKNLSSESSRSGVVWAGLALLFSVALLVLALIAKNNVVDIFVALEETETTVKMLGSVIVTLVFAVLNLVLSAVRCVLNAKEKKADAIEF